MKNQIRWKEHVIDLVELESDRAGFPAWCLDCNGQWLVFRSLDAQYSTIHGAACSVHREWSSRCREESIRVGRAITALTPFPKELEEHADSPFV